jgi:hypothetical protein
MPVAKLTKRVVDAIEIVSRRVIYYDTELKGFGLKVSPSGVKSSCVEYRPGRGGRSTAKRRMVLGSTSTLTPDQSRSAARKVLATVALGEDPAAVRTRAREMPTFLQFAERYISEKAAGAFIGNLRLDRIVSVDIAKMHRLIGQTKPVTANGVVECISAVYRYAATCGRVDRGFNPTTHIEAFREQRRERFLTSEELARLGEAIREAEQRASLGRSTKSRCGDFEPAPGVA